jgi:anti-sigma factor RsiW
MHVSPEALKYYALARLPQAEAETEVVRAHLAECESCQLNLARLSEQVWNAAEQRGETRTAVDQAASYKLLDPVTSTSPPQPAQIIETSASGMKLRVKRSMLPRTLIQVRMQDKIVLGVVKYCVEDGGEFQVGVRLVKDFPS